uniref:Uncharacterized protein n=1 Tax=Arundo donax TaxID=35708 RepID=A0A0A9EDM5_ARUDO
MLLILTSDVNGMKISNSGSPSLLSRKPPEVSRRCSHGLKTDLTLPGTDSFRATTLGMSMWLKSDQSAAQL